MNHAIPMLPVFESLRSAAGDAHPLGALASLRQNRFVRSGRLAAATAMRLAGVRDGRRVLVPAYHCPSMIDPVTALGGAPEFYRLTPTLEPDLDHVSDNIKGASASVVPHYFGTPSDLTKIRALCDDAGTVLIEDCAHTLFGPLATHGDYVVSSLRKFYPIFDGATVGSSRHEVPALPATGSALRYEAKALKNTLETAAIHGRLPLLGRIFRRRPAVATAASAEPNFAPATGVDYTDPRYDFSVSDPMMSKMSAWQLARTDVSTVNAARRQNFQTLLTGCADLENMSPWLNVLDDQMVPYVFLLLLRRPGRDFPRLKQLGLPVWRWDTLEGDVCPVSEKLRTTLLQLPCHQGLTSTEIGTMLGWLHEVDQT